eukprot:762941-Hanusia_phi.AAC.2
MIAPAIRPKEAYPAQLSIKEEEKGRESTEGEASKAWKPERQAKAERRGKERREGGEGRSGEEWRGEARRGEEKGGETTRAEQRAAARGGGNLSSDWKHNEQSDKRHLVMPQEEETVDLRSGSRQPPALPSLHILSTCERRVTTMKASRGRLRM